MGLEIIWTPQAAKGYAQILLYLDEQWTTNEVLSFENEVKQFLEQLSTYPKILKTFDARNKLRRGPINKHTILTYRIDSRSKQIQLINIYSSRQNPMI